MPVFPETSTYYKGRTNTQLVVSEGNAPAEKYLASEATNAVTQFNYEFGPEGNNSVVIPKGKIVAFAGVEYDVETEKHIPRIRMAADAATENAGAGGTEALMGVNHHNVYQRRRDRFSGSAPTILTREYIRVPLFWGSDAATAQAAAGAIKFGAMSAAINAATNTAAANLLYGQYVTSDDNGNFRAWNATTDHVDKIVGQVYGIETDIPPAGFLQYFLEFDDERYQQFIRDTQIVPSPGRTKDKMNTLDIATYPTGTGYMKTTQDLAAVLKSFKAGIPFLTDGYFKARADKIYGLADATNIKVMGGVTVNDTTKKLTIADYVGTAMFVKLPDKFATDGLASYDATRDQVPSVGNLPEFAGGPNPANIRVFLTNDTAKFKTAFTPTNEAAILSAAGLENGVSAGANLFATQVSPSNIHIDYHNNLVVVYFTGAISAQAVCNELVIMGTVLENQIPGIPTGWDFKNNIGEARILLQK